MGMEEIEKQFGVTSTSEFEEQISEKKLPEMSFIINEESDKYAEIIASPNTGCTPQIRRRPIKNIQVMHPMQLLAKSARIY